MALEQITGKAKLAFEASLKIEQGRKLMEEGSLELAHLFGAEPESKKKTIAPKTLTRSNSTFRKETRSDKEMKERIIETIGNRAMPTATIVEKCRLSTRTGDRLLQELAEAKILRDKFNGKQGSRHAWVVIAVHPEGKLSAVEARDQERRETILKFIKDNDWVHFGKLESGTGIYPQGIRRAVEVLEKEGKIKQVEKANNPAHKDEHRVYNTKMSYFEIA